MWHGSNAYSGYGQPRTKRASHNAVRLTTKRAVKRIFAVAIILAHYVPLFSRIAPAEVAKTMPNAPFEYAIFESVSHINVKVRLTQV